jgi:hypothetical protein
LIDVLHNASFQTLNQAYAYLRACWAKLPVDRDIDIQFGGEWFESGKRDHRTGETPCDNFICFRCQHEARALRLSAHHERLRLTRRSEAVRLAKLAGIKVAGPKTRLAVLPATPLAHRL